MLEKQKVWDIFQLRYEINLQEQTDRRIRQNIDLKIVILKLIIRYDCRLKKKTRETKKENKSWQRQRKDY